MEQVLSNIKKVLLGTAVGATMVGSASGFSANVSGNNVDIQSDSLRKATTITAKNTSNIKEYITNSVEKREQALWENFMKHEVYLKEQGFKNVKFISKVIKKADDEGHYQETSEHGSFVYSSINADGSIGELVGSGKGLENNYVSYNNSFKGEKNEMAHKLILSHEVGHVYFDKIKKFDTGEKKVDKALNYIFSDLDIVKTDQSKFNMKTLYSESLAEAYGGLSLLKFENNSEEAKSAIKGVSLLREGLRQSRGYILMSHNISEVGNFVLEETKNTDVSKMTHENLLKLAHKIAGKNILSSMVNHHGNISENLSPVLIVMQSVGGILTKDTKQEKVTQGFSSEIYKSFESYKKKNKEEVGLLYKMIDAKEEGVEQKKSGIYKKIIMGILNDLDERGVLEVYNTNLINLDDAINDLKKELKIKPDFRITTMASSLGKEVRENHIKSGEYKNMLGSAFIYKEGKPLAPIMEQKVGETKSFLSLQLTDNSRIEKIKNSLTDFLNKEEPEKIKTQHAIKKP